jgi:DNA-binding HxlR family transcriptional regulator
MCSWVFRAHTLSERLRTLVQLGLLRPRLYQERPPRQGYHATAKALAMFPQTLMIWQWETPVGRARHRAACAA